MPVLIREETVKGDDSRRGKYSNIHENFLLVNILIVLNNF